MIRDRRCVGHSTPATVAVIGGHFLDELFGRRLQIVRPAYAAENVQPHRGHVQHVPADLGRPVVPREHVVIVMPSFAHGHQRYGEVLRRLDAPVVKNNGEPCQRN